MWIQHPDFLSLVADENWDQGTAGDYQYLLAQNLKSLKQALKGWNKQVFGDIRLKVQATEMKVQEIQVLLDAGPTDSLHTSLAEAQTSLHNCLLQETH